MLLQNSYLKPTGGLAKLLEGLQSKVDVMILQRIQNSLKSVSL